MEYTPRRKTRNFQWTPARLTGASFFSLIAVGTILLLLPGATQTNTPASFIDALFTATSAVCVTGLTIQDTANYFSWFGQGVILVLMQLGGLGIMSLSAALPLLFGRNLKINQRTLMQDILGQDDYQQVRDLLGNIVRYTLLIEGVAALILSLHWYTLTKSIGASIYYGIFHAVSAFCNAGFALFSDSFVSYRGDAIVNSVIMILIILGGIGFGVLHEIFGKKEIRRLTTHTKISLIGTGLLILIPALFIFFTEFSNAYLHFTWVEKIFSSLFQSVTARTAGFNTVDLMSFGDATIFIICILMFIGACPGGTGGGIKVTTASILFLSVKAQLMGREQIEIFGRQVMPLQVTRAVAIAIVAFAILNVFVLTLFLTEQAPFKNILFEALSAFGTVGLSLNTTATLSEAGKYIIALLMFIGRIGPMTLVFLVGNQKAKTYYTYPEGHILVG